MAIKTSSDLLNIIRGLDNIQLNKRYRKQRIAQLKDEIKLARAKNRAGVRGFTKGHVNQLISYLKSFDKEQPFIAKIKVIIN